VTTDVAVLKKLLNSIVGQRLTVRVEDSVRFGSVMSGTIVRSFTHKDFFYRLPDHVEPPVALLVRLDSPLSTNPARDAPVMTFRYILLIVWDCNELQDLAETGVAKYRRSFHLYLLDENRLSKAHMSPERDDLDIRYTYGISKEVEVGLVNR